MQEKILNEAYPIHTMTLKKSDTTMPNIQAILTHFETAIKAHPIATYIGIFNHYKHTSSLKEGHIAPHILDAQEIICCFGKDLSDPELLAVRPRSIGIAERQDDYVISFLKAPNPAANDAMIAWTTSLKDR